MSATGTLLGQPVPIPDYFTPSEIASVQASLAETDSAYAMLAQVDDGTTRVFAELFDTDSYDLVRSTDFIETPALANFGGVSAGIGVGVNPTVLVIDSGADLDNPVFGPDNDGDGISDRIVHQMDFAHPGTTAEDTVGHGSHVAGIIAAMAPGVDLIVHKAADDGDRSVDLKFVNQSLLWAINNREAYNIVAVNLSFGVPSDAGMPFTTRDRPTSTLVPTTDAAWDLLDEQLADLAGFRVIPVAAVGNSFHELGSQQGVAFPANLTSTIAVGASFDAVIGNTGRSVFGVDALGAEYWPFDGIDNTTSADRIASFSARHPILTDVFAPGAAIASAGLNGETDEVRYGTSMAAPHATAAIAMLQSMSFAQQGELLGMLDLRPVLSSTGVSITDGDDEDDNVTNTGLTFKRLDVLAAAYKAFTPDIATLDPASDTGLSSTDGITSDDTPVISGAAPEDAYVRVYVDGVERASQQLANGASTYSVTLPVLAEGTYDITVKVSEDINTPIANLSRESDPLSIVIDTTGPQVTSLIISGSNSLHAPYNFDSVITTERQESMPRTGIQLDPVEVAPADTIEIVFSEPIDDSDLVALSNALNLVGTLTGSKPVLDTFAYEPTTNTASWKFVSWAAADQYVIRLEESVVDKAGVALDGEWKNPVNSTVTNSNVSTFPSGDMTPGGEFQFVAVLLNGDLNADGVVDDADLGILFANWSPAGSGPLTPVWELGDLNGDGLIEDADLGILFGAWNPNASFLDLFLAADLNNDWEVDAADLALFVPGATDVDGDGDMDLDDDLLFNALYPLLDGIDLTVLS